MYSIVLLLLFLALAAVILVRFVLNTVDKEFKNLARAETDEEYRRAELARLDAFLQPQLPLPLGEMPLTRPKALFRALPPIFLGLGMILLWGAAFAPPQEKNNWFASGVVTAAAGMVMLLATLKKRRRERLAALLRSRADLRRLDDDHAGAVNDLNQLLKLTPWDDAAWAELADGQLRSGDGEAALQSLRTAALLDPRYEDYYAEAAGLAIKLERFGEAADILGQWEEKTEDPRPSAKARRTAYQAALKLADNDIEAAKDFYEQAKRLDQEGLQSYMDLDEPLSPLTCFELKKGEKKNRN